MEFRGHAYIKKLEGSNSESWLNFACAHCGVKASGAVVAAYESGNESVKWLMCPNCGDASVRAISGNIYPGAAFGPEIEGLPNEVAASYKEARNCMSVNAFTACELVCRKILMHIAVEKGAKEGDTFSNYLKHLEKSGYITPPMKGWVDMIRQHGNKATHKIESPDRDRAESTIMFTAELLRLTYEMDHLAKKYTT